MELVGARLQDDVDDAALEVAFEDVIGRDLDLELADRIERHRAAAGRKAVGVEAEVIGELHAVDREAVKAPVVAGE